MENAELARNRTSKLQSDYDTFSTYELFDEWRAFERPVFVDGVPDYSADAMSRQHDELERWQDRLREMDPSDWSVEQQID